MSQAEAKPENAHQRRARLAALLRGGSSTPVPQPLSEGQRAIWYISQLDPRNSSLNLGEAVRIRGGLERAALEQALRGLLQRHELLRSRVARLSGEPFQVIEPARELPLEHLLTADDSEEALATSAGRFIDRPFDLERDLPCRFALKHTAQGDDVLVFALHHLVGEFASLLILIGELLELYAAAVGGSAPRLASLPARYQDFVMAQAQYLRDPAAITDAEYWQQQLAAAPGRLGFPLPVGAAATARSCLHSFELPAATTLAVRELSRRLEVTAYATLLSAFALLLSRRYGERDLVVGAPMTGRAEARFENVVGYFDNPLPLRFQAEPGTSVADFIRNTRKTVLGAIEHQRYPLQRIVEDQRAQGRSGAEPLFNTMFVMRQSPRRDLQDLIAFGMGDSSASTRLPSGLEVASVPLYRSQAQFDLALSLAEVQGRLVGSWELDPKRFPPEAVAALSAALAEILNEMVSRPDAALDDLSALSKSERTWLITECNATYADLGSDVLLHEPIEARMRQQPEAVAVIEGELRLSYAELDRRSRAVAAWLLARGVEPRAHVAVVMEKGWEQVVAVLGALRAGAAYLPIDAKLPAQRRQQLLALGDARLALTQTRWADSAWPAGVQHLDVSRVEPSDAALPRSTVQPGELAYTIFTSGSTGEPKGVMIHHRGALNTLRDVSQRLGVAPGDAVLGLSALSFDLSVYDIFGVLGAGATLVLPDAERLYEPAHWVALVEQHAVTLWNSVPSFFKLALEHIEGHAASAAALRTLRAVFLSGDWIPLDLPARARQACGEHRFISMGGATEGSVWSIWYEVDRVDPAWNSIPYGYPMTNQHFHVLDGQSRPCPVGVTGELYIGGAGVLLGYWHAPELDAHALREFAGIPGRVYRTGDLGRRRSDGNIEFLGRADFQVKVRGFRVEPGEIEAALLRHRALSEVVVTAQRHGDENRLVAYVVLKAAASADELRAHLAAQLPGYMIPSSWTFLDALPLSQNGKLDRKALPAPEATRQATGAGDSPRQVVAAEQRALLDIVARTLALTEVGLQDDLLALGADSIQLIRIAARLQEAGYAVTSRDLFATTGLGALAQRLQKRETQEDGPLPTLSWQRQVLELGARRYECRLGCSGPLGEDQVRAAWARLVERHEALRITLELDQQRLADAATLEHRKHVAIELDADDALARHERADERDAAVLTVVHGTAGATLLLSAPASLTDAFGFRVLVEELVGELSPESTPAPPTRSFLSWVASRPPAGAAFAPDPRTDPHRNSAFATLDTEASAALAAAGAHRLTVADLALLSADRVRPGRAGCVAVHARHGATPGTPPRVAPASSELRHLLEDQAPAAHCLRRLEQLQSAASGDRQPDLALVIVEPNGAGRALRESRFRALSWTDQVVVDRVEPCVVMLEEQRDERGVRLVWHCWSTLDETPETTLSKLSSALLQVAEELTATPIKALPQHFPLARLTTSSLERLLTRYPHLEDVWELGPMQQTMLLHAAVDQTPGLYCHHVHWDVVGELDVPRLRRAFDSLLTELPNLRVAFELEDAEAPVQVVLPPRSPSFEIEQVAREQLDERLRARIAADRALGFDLRRPPLLRVTLLQVSAQLQRLVICHHHLLFDGWSIGILQKRLLAAYAGEAQSVPAANFESFIGWSATEPRAERAAYWHELLAGVPQLTPLGFQDRRPSSHQGFVHEELEAIWEASFVSRLEQAARAARVTPGSALLAAWGVLLARFAERDDVVFGVTGSGRPESLPGADQIVGLLINSVPLRVRLSEGQSLRELVREVQAQYATSRLYEQVSLRELTEYSGVRDFRPFDSLVIFENFEGRAPQALGGLGFEAFEFSEQTNAPIALYVLPGPRWTLRFTFDAARFCRATVAALVEQLRCCLEAFVTTDTAPAKSVSLAAPGERARLASFNATHVEWQEDATLCDLLALQAQRQPQAVAVVDGERQLTYAMLLERARAWARVLVRRGVEPGDRVGLSCRRSAEWLTALYAILEAGACYVPLDDAAPAQRNLGILEDAGVKLLVTDRASASAGKVRAASTLLVDADPELLLSPAPTAAAASRPSADSPAYVIYTSGSTGTPKGVVVSHGAVVNYARGTGVTYGFAVSDRILQFFSPSFDGAGEEIFGALANGATLVLRAEDALDSFQRLNGHLLERGVTALSLPTAVWHAWTADLEQSGTSLPEALRIVIIGGERALPARVASWRRLTAHGGPRLFNSYGPTEATIVALVADLSAWELELERDREIPIGRPVPNVQAFVVDGANQPCPQGAPGELMLAGAGLAHGYLGRPELTAERFVELAALPGRRLYRTGDRVRLRDDGQLEFLGRLDDQVKVRGYRVELREIELALLAQPDVREAVVSAMPSGDHSILVAHVVAAAGVKADFALRLRESLRSELPSYMVPAAMGIVDAIPLNERGKLDRGRLPKLETDEPAGSRPPGNDTERAIATIWAEVLGLPQVNVDQEFFDAGGHSLAALRLLGRLQQELGLNVSLRELYAAPTVAHLAQLAERGQVRDDAGLVSLMSSDARLPLPSFAGAQAVIEAPRAILLTGATGFLGTFLLGELLVSTRAEIWCIARDGQGAFARVERALRRAGLWRHGAVTRIRPLTGDLAAERLGLGDAEYRMLSERVDHVVHNGARVNFIEPYEALRATNVLGTRAILELCAAGRRKSLHYVSTLAVFDPNAASGSIEETWLPDEPSALPSGYGQSKWVAEQLVARALRSGLPGVVYRPGRISGHSSSGAWQDDDLACQMLAACAAVGMMPELDTVVDLTPVDYVAQAVVSSVVRGDSGGLLHLTNPGAARLAHVSQMLADSGLPLAGVELRVWMSAISALTLGDPSHPWAQLAALLELWQEGLRPPKHGAPSFSSRNTAALLAARDITCSALDQRLLGTYLGWMRGRGLLATTREAR